VPTRSFRSRLTSHGGVYLNVPVRNAPEPFGVTWSSRVAEKVRLLVPQSIATFGSTFGVSLVAAMILILKPPSWLLRYREGRSLDALPECALQCDRGPWLRDPRTRAALPKGRDGSSPDHPPEKSRNHIKRRTLC
jgi:hypothetical protein